MCNISISLPPLISGYKLGCSLNQDQPSDFTSVSLEDVAQSLDQESLDNMEEENDIDRYDGDNNRPTKPNRYETKKRPIYPNRYENDNDQSYPNRYQNDNDQSYPDRYQNDNKQSSHNRYPNDNKQSYPNRYQNGNKQSQPNRYENNDRPAYPERPNIYKDKHIYDAFNYDSDSSRGELRPAHRPFINNGPAIVDRDYISKPNRYI